MSNLSLKMILKLSRNDGKIYRPLIFPESNYVFSFLFLIVHFTGIYQKNISDLLFLFIPPCKTTNTNCHGMKEIFISSAELT